MSTRDKLIATAIIVGSTIAGFCVTYFLPSLLSH
jgi:hypothetical protein